MNGFTNVPYTNTSDNVRWWIAICSNRDLTKSFAASDFIYSSLDSGTSWTRMTNSDNRSWSCMTLSTDENLLVACANPGYIYISTNLGSTWTERAAALGSKMWSGICSNSNGNILAASAQMDYIYVSSNSGVDWTIRISSGNENWAGIMFSNNNFFAYAAWKGLFKSSDLGNTWINIFPQAIGKLLFDLTMSLDGTKMVACVLYNPIYTSINSGSTWVEEINLDNTTANSWYNVSSSEDGTKLFLSRRRDYLYTIR